MIKETLLKPDDAVKLPRGRVAYWNDSKRLKVVYNKNAGDFGTAFNMKNHIKFVKNITKNKALREFLKERFKNNFSSIKWRVFTKGENNLIIEDIYEV